MESKKIPPYGIKCVKCGAELNPWNKYHWAKGKKGPIHFICEDCLKRGKHDGH